MTMRELVDENNQLFSENCSEFREVFGISLDGFSCPLSGFMVIAFRDYLMQADCTKSVYELVEEGWGQEGLSLIFRLVRRQLKPAKTGMGTGFTV